MYIYRERERKRKSGRMGWAGKVAEIENTVKKNKFQLENLKRRSYLK
jgi:hypothetical protein